MGFELEWAVRMICAASAGSLIGYERHSHSKEAGIRTHAIVAAGACLVMIISKYGFFESGNEDPTRLAAQVVSGVGFLGAGIIFVRHDMIQGLTTAAGIWATSAIGLCFGAGLYGMGIFTALLIFAVQLFFRRIFAFSAPRTVIPLKIHMKRGGTARDVSECLKGLGYSHSENRISAGKDDWILQTEVYTLKDADPLEIIEGLKKSDVIIDAEVESQ